MNAKSYGRRKGSYESGGPFSRAYYYFNLFKQYGPIYLWYDQIADLAIKSEVIDRNTVDECVGFIEKEMYDAAQILPKTIQDPTTWMGRMTKGAALGMRSRVLLFAARPLFNGGGSIGYGRGMVNHEGKPIFPQGEDLNKWTKAAEAAKMVIDLDVYKLHFNKTETDPVLKAMNSYREVFTEKWNEELIIARYYKVVRYGINGLFPQEYLEWAWVVILPP